MKRFVAATIVFVLVAALVMVASSSVYAGKKPPPPPPPKGCQCTDIYAPVLCSNGVTYPNGCYAACDGATGCVPIGGI